MLHFSAPFALLFHYLQQLSSDAELIVIHGRKAIRMFDGAISVVQEETAVAIEWTADSVNDMYADAVLAVILQIESNPRELEISVKEEGAKKKDSKFPDRLLKLMREMFGPQNVNWSHEDQEKIEICVDSNKALLDPTTMAVECGDDSLNHLVSAAAKRLQNALSCQS